MNEATKERYEARIRNLEQALEESEGENERHIKEAGNLYSKLREKGREITDLKSEVLRLKRLLKTGAGGYNAKLIQENANLLAQQTAVRSEGNALQVERQKLRDINRDLTERLNWYVINSEVQYEDE